MTWCWIQQCAHNSWTVAYWGRKGALSWIQHSVLIIAGLSLNWLSVRRTVKILCQAHTIFMFCNIICFFFVATPTNLSTHRPTHLLTCCQGVDTLTRGTSVYLFRSHPKNLWPIAMYLLQVFSQESLAQLSSSLDQTGTWPTTFQ